MPAAGAAAADAPPLSGSYDPADVTFLLRVLSVASTSVAEKERLIQSGARHYSEMISRETPASPEHMALFAEAMEVGAVRVGREVASLALALAQAVPDRPLILASLVRAGVPLGVLLRRALLDLGREVHHYGISIVRDRGIDRAAIDTILARHGQGGGAAGLVFVDGWTGKGAIAGELERSLGGDPRLAGPPRLVTLADPCGRSWLAASGEDWLIPSGILGATVSGLISRSILTCDGGYHGCMRWEHLAEQDVSRDFVEQVDRLRRLQQAGAGPARWTEAERQALQASSEGVIASLAAAHGITSRNRIKPGIAEATRAVMRRVPDRVLVRDAADPDVRLLVHLARRAGVVIEVAGGRLGPYRAVTLIQKVV